MENNQLLLSICIPTNGIVEWVLPVIESIYSQGVDYSLFEVIVTDNGKKTDLEDAIMKFDYPNFNYYKTTSQGFSNQLDAFEKCNGLFCKMLNHRSRMVQGSIVALLTLIRRYQNTKPIIYCAEGRVKGDSIIECSDTDDFVQRLSYWISWSAGIGAWKTDLKNLRHKETNNMFPHMVFLFGLRDESKYVIWNEKYEDMANDAGKGGYDLFRTFGVTFLDVINELRIKERISSSTFILVKNELYYFLRGLYLNEVLMPTNHTFIIQNVAESFDIYYGRYYYLKMIIYTRLFKVYAYVKRILGIRSGL